jgi:predicted permease
VSVAATFAFILALLAVGRALAAAKAVPANAAETLNLVVLYVCLPAAVLLNASKLVFDPALVKLVAVPWILLGLSVGCVWLLDRLLQFDAATRACLLLLVPLGNTSFIGFPLVPVLAGPDALRYAVAYDQFGSFPMLATYGLVVIALYGGGARPTLRSTTRRMLTFPPFIALVVALTLVPAEPPPWLAQPLQLLSGALLPLVVLALGMQLRLRLPREHRVPLGIALAGKLVALPLAALGLCDALGLGGTMRAAVVYESAMPAMITAGALLSLAGLAPRLVAAITGYGIVLSMATLPLLHGLLR